MQKTEFYYNPRNTIYYFKLFFEIVLAITLLCLCAESKAQTISVDSIKNWIKVNDQIFRTDPELALNNVSEFKNRLSSENQNFAVQTELTYAQSKYTFRIKEHDKCIEFSKKGVKDELEHGRRNRLAGFYNILGACYMIKATLDSSAHYLMLAANELENRNEPIKAASVYNNIGSLFFDNSDTKKAVKYINEAKKILESENDSILLPSIVGNLSYVQFFNGEFESSEQNASKSIELGKRYDDLSGIVYGLLVNGLNENRLGNKPKAIEYLETAIEYCEKANNAYFKAMASMTLADILQGIDNERALLLAEAALSELINNSPRFASYSFLILSKIYESEQNYKLAYDFLLQGKSMQDSLRASRYQRNQQELLEKYNAAEASRLINRQEAKIYKNGLHLRNLLLGILGLVALLLGLGAFILYTKKITNQRLENMRSSAKIKELKAYLDGESLERERLAKEMHDGMANEISATKFFIEANSNKELKDNLLMGTILEQLSKLHDNARSIAHDLLPKEILHGNLKSSINNYASKFNSKDISISVNVVYPNNSNNRFEKDLFRIVQEGISNAVKHAQASQLRVELILINDIINIVFSDNGLGIKSDEGSVYLYLKQRVKAMNGEIRITTNPNSYGTLVKILIPNYK